MNMHTAWTDVVRPGRAALLASVAAMGIATLAQAIGDPEFYGPVTHNFVLTVSGTQTPEVELCYLFKASANDDGAVVKRRRSACSPDLNPPALTVTSGQSTATANGSAMIGARTPGRLAGTVSSFGSTDPNVAPIRYARAAAGSMVRVRARTGPGGTSGSARSAGKWKVSDTAFGGRGAHRSISDPVIARLIDRTTGVTQEWTMITIKNELLGGTFEWDNDVVSSTAVEMIFEIDVPGEITDQQGSLSLHVEGGIVTEASATGMFAGTGLPAIGDGSAFSFALANEIAVDFDMGADPSHDLETEFDFENADGTEKVTGDLWQNGGMLTHLALGFEDADVSETQAGGTFGWSAQVGLASLADDFFVQPGRTFRPEALVWPFYQTIGPAETPIQAAFVRLWLGNPGSGGVPIAGDLFTDRLLHARDLGAFRVPISVPLDTRRPIQEALIDMSWAPELGPGEYWIEVAGVPAAGVPSLWTPPAVNRSGNENAVQFVDSLGLWAPMIDGATGQAMDVPFELIGGVSDDGDQWAEGFAQYPVGFSMHGRGGWEGWDHDPEAAAFVADVQSRSGGRSLGVSGQSDIVRTFQNAEGGTWTLSAWQFIPLDFFDPGSEPFDGTFLVMLNTYPTAGDDSWSVQIQFDPTDQMMKVFHGDGLGTIDVPYIADRWVQIQVVIDLDNDLTRVFYDGSLVAEYPWTGGVLGGGAGARQVAAVDLFANGSTAVYWDDLLLGFQGGSCPGDLTGDGILDVSDFFAFIVAFSTGDPAADINGDGSVSVLDFFAFIVAFDAGCP